MSQSAETSDIAASAIRQALRREFGPRRYRIDRDGWIHVYSFKQSTNAFGWWVFGYVDEPETLARLGVDS